jgi:hypothetical protein
MVKGKRNMKNACIVIVLLALFVGCEKAIHITQPTILVRTESPKVFDTIQISCVEYAEIDGERQSPDHFSWSILDKDMHVVHSGFKDSAAINWIPDRAGYFIISSEIGYNKNKSITTLKEIEVHESALSLQKKLVGKWTGNAVSIWGAKWQVDLEFDKVGHYIGKGYNLQYANGNYPIGGPFQSATYVVDFTSNLPPSEDVPCTRFLINKIIEDAGFGKLSVSTETKNGTEYLAECVEIYYIEDFKFSTGDKSLYFSLNSMYNQRGEWEIRYNLSKME